jgi:hypothetical protein
MMRIIAGGIVPTVARGMGEGWGARVNGLGCLIVIYPMIWKMLKIRRIAIKRIAVRKQYVEWSSPFMYSSKS